ncbi:RTX toxin [Vibrio cholerae]|uniref:T1SS-143 repeat domain-containing protein n=1 Tax=Vibrio cholerae TaxID=666 RepID=UPI0015FDB33A|nr:RTX toxin [Vibrio cholerae]EGQ9168524.1 RTX toxin [Vibrio cholerae]MBA8611356.1 RTX toxin [Vibrio cholerae]MBJ6878256.1 RTX toxin [Vibrio cholerae]MBJ6882082.1 RTX toxin [Vibrio cholerae]MBJ6889609.1 RTX toxin [Vibrio cholerae]
MIPVLYIEVGGVVWQVMPDGTWQQIPADAPKQPNVTVLVQQAAAVATTPLTPQEIQVIEQQLEQVVESLAQYTARTQSVDGSYAASSSQGSESVSYVTYLEATLSETLAQAGFDTRPDDNFAEKNNDNNIETLDILSDRASLTVTILDGGDGVENRFEVPVVTILGQAFDVRDNRIVQITITDVNGKSVVTSAIVDNQAYQVNGVNLSGLAEGPLKVHAVIADNFGNQIEAADSTLKDTLAQVGVQFDGFGDEFYNRFEVGSGSLKGTAQYIEDGQPITITIVDSQGKSITVTTSVFGGTWQVNNLDLSRLAEGVLKVTASSIDKAGNPANATDTIVKDTLAAITADVVDGSDGVLNSIEKHAVTLSGTVSNVEDGQTVHITVTDINNQQVTLTAQVNHGQWQVSGVDLSSFADGVVTVSASTVDVAGNPTSTTDTSTVIDTTVPTIDIDTLSGLSILDFRNGKLTSIQGTTTGVDEGLPVQVIVSDGLKTLIFSGVVDSVGNWLVSGIDVSTLDLSKTWTINASVENSIGNQAMDDMPTIVLPDSVSFSENVIGIFGHQTHAVDINIENAEFSFHPNQTLLSSITSQGSAITVIVAADGQTLEGRTSAGVLVFHAAISGSQVNLTFYKPVDQASGLNTLQTAVLVQGVQTDADGTTETVIGHLAIQIKDSEPLVFGDEYEMVEGSTSSGNVLNNDIDLDAPLVVRQVTFNGVTQTITGNQPVTFNTADGVLKVFGNGHWTFVANRDLDHTSPHTISFDYVAGDSSNDYGSATAVITITDGAAGKIQNGGTHVTENRVEQGVLTVDGGFTVSGGSDNPDPSSLVFDASTLTLLNALGLSSSISLLPLTYSLSGDGKIITAQVAGQTVFTLTLSGIANGNDVAAKVQLVQSLPLNHANRLNSITLPLQIKGTDTDGTPLDSGRFDFIIIDGQDPSMANNTAVVIDESALSGGAITQHGSFDIQVGSDYLKSVYMDVGDQPILTSGGVQLVYTISPDGNTLTAYLDSGDGTPSAIQVFTLSFVEPSASSSSTVSYTFILHQALDQSHGTDSLPFVVTVVDKDGDETQLVLDVSITDGGSAQIGFGTVELTEVPIAAGTPSGVGTQAQVQVNVTASHDPIVYLGLNVVDGQAVQDSDGMAVTHNGQALVWRDNGDGSYSAVLSNGDAVFKVQLPDNFSLAAGQTQAITITLELYQAVDHLGSGKDTELNIPVAITTTDSDGSVVSTTSTIKIYDGTLPTLSITGSVSVDEDGLIGDGQQAGSENNPPSIAIVEGSDDVVAVVVDVTAFNAQNYQSGGKFISLSNVDSDGWWYAKDTDGTEVFRIRFNLDGTVEFDLYQPLDHADGNGENNLALNFSLSVQDADGDVSTSATYSVNVKDAVPEAWSDDVGIIEGDTLSGNLLDMNKMGADGGSIVSVLYDADGDGNKETYTFSGSSLTLTLHNSFDNSSYGTITIYPNGSFSLTTNSSVATDPNSPFLNDSLQFVVQDGDGDQVTCTANLVLDDATGFIRVDDVEITEDHSATLSIQVATGDIDQSEMVSQIEISEASLQGGKLYLNGVELSIVGGKVVLTGSQLDYTDPQFVKPNGTLTYLPALNQSNTTINVSLAITAIISTDTTPKELHQTLEVSILPIADTPSWSNSQFEYSATEDTSTPIQFSISAGLFDTDSSESLTYKISNIPAGLTITLNGNPINPNKGYTQAQLDKMEIHADKNFAGTFTFDIEAIATESGNVFADPADKTASITHQVTVNISPDADAPTLSVKDIKGLEDQNINLKEYIVGHLTDTDGSESLSFLIEVQAGWQIQGGVFLSGNTYQITAADLVAGNVWLVPKEDISSYTETLTLKVTAVSTESTIDGLAPIHSQATSSTQTITVYLKGVVDAPTVVDGGQGHWQFDDVTKVISNASVAVEDGLIALDFVVQTTDDDSSEIINLLLTNIPDGVVLVDSAGQPVALTIASIDPVTGPVYQVSNAQLANLYLKPIKDFSGKISLDVIAISTEPDGDSGEFPLKLEVTISPKVDQSNGQVIATTGIEDRSIGLHLNPSINQDIDGSETLTGYKITSLDAHLTLYFDGNPITIPVGGLDLSTFIDATSPTLADLLSSGRFSVKASEDLSGQFTVGIEYQVTDTSPLGATDVKWITGSLSVTVEARVELDTRLEGSNDPYISHDGSPVDISHAVSFTDADLDGSEHLEYILIRVPSGYQLIVEHPNGASQDAAGNWLIPATGLTSSSVKETMAYILNGATISSASDTPLLTIEVLAYVKDGNDARYIDATFQLQITGHSGGGSCDPVGTPGNIQTGDLVSQEGTDIDLSGLLNTNVGSDPDNALSFYIPASSLPPGVEISGDGVVPEYDSAGNIVGYSISAGALEHLTLTGIDEDFAGCLQFTIQTIETSPCNGTSVTTDQTITIQVVPVVDNITVSSSVSVIQEDAVTDLNLQFLLGDSVESGQTISGEGNSATGKETVNSLTVSVTNGATLQEIPNNTGLLVDNGNGTYTITDPSRLGDIQLIPPAHFSGEISMTFNANITDQADCVSQTDTQNKSTTVTITVEPVADKVDFIADNVLGNEDQYISLGNLSATMVDNDGSEYMSLSLKGVPAGAVVVYKVGSSYELAANNGEDGGRFNGNSTYEWQIDPARLADLYILPPLDFSGDIPLSLAAITQEIANGDLNNSNIDFVVGVKPIGDAVSFLDVPESLTGNEDGSVLITLNAESFETNSDEFLMVVFTVNSSSDPSGLVGLDKIRVGLQSANFHTLPDGAALATLLIRHDELDELRFFPGDAFGELDVTLTVRSYDQNVVLGNQVSDLGEAKSEQITITIAPQPDEPILTLEYPSIVAEAAGHIPLGLHLQLVNPATNEEGKIEISGLPAGLQLNHGTFEQGKYWVDLDDVADLAIVGGYNGASQFTLSIEPSASIGSDSANAPAQLLTVNLVAVGDSILTATAASDLLIGGAGADTFLFESNGLGSAGAVTQDVIQDFTTQDAIDIKALLSAVTDGSSADGQIDLLSSAEGVTLSIKPNGSDVQQEIVLKGVTLDDLYQGSTSGISEADILQKMIDDHTLVVQ